MDISKQAPKQTCWNTDVSVRHTPFHSHLSELKIFSSTIYASDCDKLCRIWSLQVFIYFYLRKSSENIEPGVGKWVSYLNRERKLDSLVGRCPSAPHAPRGLYIYGNVGSGKFLTTIKFYMASLDISYHFTLIYAYNLTITVIYAYNFTINLILICWTNF